MEIPVIFFVTSILFSSLNADPIEPILKQFQESGDLGQYAFGYQSGIERRSESRNPDGAIQGSYSYLDANGKVQLVRYTAGIDGFQVMATNLPIESGTHEQTPVVTRAETVSPVISGGILMETPEVIAARMQHAAAHAAALRLVPQTELQRNIPLRSSFVNGFEERGVLIDTPEVLVAKMQHDAAHAAALRTVPRLNQQQNFRNIPDQTIPVIDNFVQPGILGDTPEVSLAKMQHLAAHSAIVRKIAPQVPQYRSLAVPTASFTHPMTIRYNQEGPKFAEDVPRSALGETPEVAEAREAHLAEYERVKSKLPRDGGL